MKNTNLTLLLGAGLLGTVISQAASIIGAWDFNDQALIGDQAGLPDYETDVGTQSGAGGILLVINEARGDSAPFEINNEGSITGDTWNSPAVAGNGIGFLHGSRVDDTYVEIHFDASSFTSDVTMNFAINRKHSDGVDTYQASYSTDGISFTNLGSSVTFDNTWNLETIDFGTVFSGASNAIARFQLSNGGAIWNEEHQTNMDNVSLSIVPEPSTYALALGLLALGGVMLLRRIRG